MLRARSRYGRKKAVTVVEACVLTGITVILGILLMLVVNGWSQDFLSRMTDETDRNIEVVRSSVVIESALLEGDRDVSLILRNVSNEDIAVAITKIELRSLDTSKVFYVAYLPNDEKYILRRGESLIIADLPTCEKLDKRELREECSSSGRVGYRAYYMPVTVREKGFHLSTTEILTGDLILTNPGVRLECPLPSEGWVLLDLADPVTIVSTGYLYADTFGRGRIWIQAPLASGLRTITVSAVVTRMTGSAASASGSASISVPSDSQQYSIPLSGSVSQIYVPFRITLSSPNVRIIPREWIFGGQVNVAHVSGIILSWRTEDKLVDSALVELGFGQAGTYEISLTLRNCNGRVIATGSNIISATASSKATVFIILDNPVRLDQVYFVLSEVRKIG